MAFGKTSRLVSLLDNDHSKHGKVPYSTCIKVQSPKVLLTVKNLIVILKAGVVIWHDYDVEYELVDVLHHLAKNYLICHIDGTRLAYLKVQLQNNLILSKKKFLPR